MDKPDLITQYIFAGFSLMELRGKIPVRKNWTEETFEINPYTKHNVGVVLSDTDLVIDVDPRNFKQEEFALDKLKEFFPENISTMQVQTGDMGWHIYLKKPADLKIRKNVKGLSGLDFLRKGNYVVAPFSIHPDTKKEYKLIKGSPFEIADAPAELLDLLALKNIDEIAEETSKDRNYDDTVENVLRYEKYLEEAEVAIEGNHGDETTYKIACIGKDFGLSAEATFKAMWKDWNWRCNPVWTYENLWEKVCNAFKYSQTEQKYYMSKIFNDFDVTQEKFWDLTKSKEIKPKLINIVNILDGYDKNLNNLFRYNELTHRIEFQRTPFWRKDIDQKATAMTDYDLVEIRHYLSKKFNGLEPPASIVWDAVLLISKKFSYHPIKNYLQALKWDGKPRLETWLINSAGIDDNAYSREVSRKFILAAVARIFNPGCKFDNIVVLEGAQGVRKSTLCSILGGEWFADLSLDLKSKDSVETLQGKWIIEISEMGIMRKTDAQSLKAFLSRGVDRIRLPYGRLSEDFPRSCIFIGTINPAGSGYLKDSTGNRRFWILETKGKIKTEDIASIRNQLYAEAVFEVKKGNFKLYLENYKALEISEREAAKRQITDSFYNDVKTYLQNKNETSIEQVALASLAIPASGLSPIVTDRIATVLIQLGFEKTFKDGYVVYKRI